jgi:hypothetical protein
MKKHFQMIVLIAIALFITACAEKEKSKKFNGGEPPKVATIPDHSITLPATNADFSTLVLTVIPYADSQVVGTINVDGYSLDQFITKSFTDIKVFVSGTPAGDSRNLFTYRFIATDGWNPWENRGAKDQPWEFVKEGFYVPGQRNGRIYSIDWYNDNDLRAYCVQRMGGGRIGLIRSVTVVNPIGKEVPFHLNTLPIADAINNDGNPSPAIKLKDLITEYITDTPERFSYIITTMDNVASLSKPIWTWANIESGFWFLNEDRTLVPGLGGQGRQRYLMKITLVNTE